MRFDVFLVLACFEFLVNGQLLVSRNWVSRCMHACSVVIDTQNACMLTCMYILLPVWWWPLCLLFGSNTGWLNQTFSVVRDPFLTCSSSIVADTHHFVAGRSAEHSGGREAQNETPLQQVWMASKHLRSCARVGSHQECASG